MPLSILTDHDYERNRILRVALELVTNADTTPAVGQIAMTNGSAVTLPKWSVIIRDNDIVPGWRVLGAINKLQTVTGFWEFFTATKADGVTAAAPGDPPFGVNSLRTGIVPNLNADRLDSWHAFTPGDGSTTPTNDSIPVYDANSRLIANDPLNSYHVVNLKTLQAASQGISPRNPCQYATAADLGGTLSGNTLTGPLVALSVDGFTPIVTDRILVKNQTNTINNGIYTVQVVGVAGTTAWVLLRALDADSSTEVKVGTTTYIEKGTVNIATQWQCSVAGALNTDPNLWVKSFQASAYVAGNGMDLEGLKFHFGTRALYTVGSLWYSNASTTVTQLPPPATLKFLRNPGPNPGGVPVWGDVSWAEITNKPILPTAPDVPGGTVGRYTRWNTGNALVDANLYDTGANVQGVGNTLVAAPVVLGGLNAPFGLLWTNEIRLASTPGAAGGPLQLYGNQLAADDSNGNHRRVVTFTAAQVKSWLVLAPSDSNAVPVSTTLTINGTVGQINVATQPTWDLSANRAWTLSLDLSTLDNHWMFASSTPGPTAQDVSSPKRWYSTTGTATEMMIQVGLTQNPTVPKWLVRADGTVMWGDGTIAPAAGIDYSSGLRVFGAQLEFAATAPVKFTSATAPGVAPSFVLGLDAGDITRRYTAANLATLIGQPTLAQFAVGYGDVNSKLTGIAGDFRWDYTNKRLGINLGAGNSPVSTLDMVGNFKLTNTSLTGAPSLYPGIQVSVSDTSTSTPDWTGRTMFGAQIDARKNGSATHSGSAYIYGMRVFAGITGGSLSNIFGIESAPLAGAASGAPAVTNVISYKSSPEGLGATGTITNLYHYYATNPINSFPQAQVHYGFYALDLNSASPATRTAGIALAISSTGTGERYNIFASGAAPSHFGGALGLGVSYATATSPTARLELALGATTGLAPIRFSPSGTPGAILPLLTTPLAGVLENRGDRLMFTDNVTVPVRRPLAYMDDLGFTNDTGSQQAGALVLGKNDYVNAPMTPEVIGAAAFTIWVRFLVPIGGYRGASHDHIISINDGALGANSAHSNSAFIEIDASRRLICSLATSEGNQRQEYTPGAWATQWAGKIVDVVFVRNGTTRAQVYVNGVLEPTSEQQYGTVPPYNMPVQSTVCRIGNAYTTYGSIGTIYRAVVFNRLLTSAQIVSLSRNGVDQGDQWASQVNILAATDAAFTTDSGYWEKGGGATIGGGIGTLPALSAYIRRNTSPYAMKTGKNYRSTATFPTLTGSVRVSDSFTDQGVPYTAPGTYTTEFFSTATAFMYVQRAAGASTLDDITLLAIGAIIDLNFAVGCGTIIPDRSGRYHGTITGSNYYHLLPTCPTELPQGPGTITSGLRRYTETITAIDGQTKSITHNLGSNNVTVTVWDSNNELVNVAVKKRPGVELTTGIDIVFGLINSPSTPLSFQVIIIG